MRKSAFLVFFLIAITSTGRASEQSQRFFPDYDAYNDAGKKILDRLHPQNGTVDLPNGIHLTLGDKFYFLNHADSGVVLNEAWGNPPQTSEATIGMIFPARYDPLAENSWGIELRVDQIGFVDDEDAASIDYDALLASMQADTLANNAERQEQGFEPIRLVGWAAAPTYDPVGKRLHWAKELQFGTEERHTLNYDIRVLGREGVFVMSYIAKMDQLPEITQSLPEVLSIAEFGAGKRYADFVPGIDTVAAIGVGGLVAGKLAAKAGLLAIALVALKKFGVVVLFPLAWLVQFVRRKNRSS